MAAEGQLDAELEVTRDNAQVKLPTGNNRGLSQAYQIRDFSATEALSLKDCEATTLEQKAARAQALRSLAYVWTEASERIRILRNRPMPGSLRPVAAAKKSKKPSAIPVESEPPQ